MTRRPEAVAVWYLNREVERLHERITGAGEESSVAAVLAEEAMALRVAIAKLEGDR